MGEWMDSQEIKMDDKEISRLQGTQQDLLSTMKTSCTSATNDKSELLKNCKSFLENQSKYLQILEEKRRIHLMEEGKVKFKLVAVEQVTVADLKDLYQVFAKQSEEFIQFITRMARLVSSNTGSIFIKIKQEAINMMAKMLEISLVLECQPDSVNYDKTHNQIPTLLCLGAQCLSDSDFSIVDSQVTIVSEADLLNASNGNISLGDVKGLDGVAVKTNSDKKKTAANSNAPGDKLKAVAINLGTWSIPKEKLSTSDKGNAHKDWVRLKFTMQVKYQGATKSLLLLSLPFNIRKGSVQMYTFIGALMWYFYITADPYKEFSVKTRLPTSTFLDMLIARLEYIGRKLSSEETAFFNELLMLLSSNRTPVPTIDLETVTRGPPSKKVPDSEMVKKTPTVKETVDVYGFFTWFYALVNSLDDNGYLHDYWMDGYIHIFGAERAQEIVLDDKFGHQVVIIRPSMSHIYNHQGKNIHMGFSFFYKTLRTGVVSQRKSNKVKTYTLSLQMADLVKCGFYVCLTDGLPLSFIFMRDGTLKSIADLQSVYHEQIYLYHFTKFKRSRGPILAECDAMSKHCTTCRCHIEEVNSWSDGESKSKKVRSPSGNSDHISSSSDWPNGVLVHKLENPQSVCSSVGNQVTSSANMTLSNEWGNGDCLMMRTDDSITESPISSYQNMLPDFNKIESSGNSPLRQMPPSTTKSFDVSSTTNRDALINNFRRAALSMSFPPSCSDEMIVTLTNKLQSIVAEMSNPTPLASSPETITQSFDQSPGSNDSRFTDLTSVSCVEENFAEFGCLDDDSASNLQNIELEPWNASYDNSFQFNFELNHAMSSTTNISNGNSNIMSNFLPNLTQMQPSQVWIGN